MAFKLTKKDHKQLDAFLGEVLDDYKSGNQTRGQAIGALAHVFTAGVIDNEGEVKAWLTGEPYKNLKEMQ